MNIYTKDGKLSFFVTACKDWLNLEIEAVKRMHEMLGKPAWMK